MKRRNFLQSAALAGSAAMVAPSALAEGLRRERISEFGFQAYTVRDVIYDDMAGTLKTLRKAGYDFMEGFDFGDGKLLRKPIKEAKEILEDQKMGVKSLHVMTGAMAPDMKGTMINDWQMAVDDAAELGAEYIVCAYLMDFERENIDQYKELSELFNKCGETAKKAGLQFAYHNHDFEFQTLDGQMPMDVILAETEEDLVKIELDIYWARHAEQNPIKFFRDNYQRVPLWHVKDLSLEDGKPMTEVGNGIIDWKQIFRHKKDAGMKYFFVEQDRNYQKNSLESLQTSIKYLKKMNY